MSPLVSDRESSDTGRWPVAKLERIRPVTDVGSAVNEPSPEEYSDDDGQPAHLLVLAALSELRRRWKLALAISFLVVAPVFAYAVLAVPTYTAEGSLQVSSQGGAMNPLLELTGAGANGEVQTEVEIIRRREFVLAVLKDLKLNIVDPHQPSSVTRDLSIAIGGQSPVDDRLRQVRTAAQTVAVHDHVFSKVPVTVTGLAGDRVAVEVGGPVDPRSYELAPGEALDDPEVALTFAAAPLVEGESIELAVLPDGRLIEGAMKKLGVASLGTARQQTNLVRVTFNDPDRATAQAVVDGIMQRYLDQSLKWQTASASSAAGFIAERLEEAQEDLSGSEDELRVFAEKERTVKLDTQAEVTIESAAELEAEKRQIELQERVIGSVASGMKRRTSVGGANLTSNFFEDPVLAASVAALTEAETQYSVLSATLTPEHPQVVAMHKQIKLRQREVNRLLRSAQRNLSQQRKELDKRLETAMSSLSDYPEKELQLARHMRDVETNQKLFAFLLEKHQEARILEASTTVDKRIVDAADLPWKKASPARGKLVLSGLLGGLMAAFAAVYLAHLLQRRLETVEAVKTALPFPVYGTVPVSADMGGKKKTSKGKKPSHDKRLNPAAVWNDSHGPMAEAFRAIAVNVSLMPTAQDRGRIVQVTSSQPSEGKSTIISNLAVALSKAGASVLVVDLDLRKPVQHRVWGMRRSPGYADLVAKGEGPRQAVQALQKRKDFDIDVLTAGTKLPDSLRVLMNNKLESMLVYWSERYDYVLVDSPPAFVADTTVAAKHADLVLVVARPGVVERGNVKQALESLNRVQAAKGLVLSAVERKHSEYYYGNAYYYQQSYGAPSPDDSGDEHQAAS